jgi:hypothetical protein
MHTNLSPTGALRQAGMTAEEYLGDAVRAIDKKFGQDYAKKNPALVAAFMQVCAKDYATWALCDIAGDLENLLDGILDREAA